MQPWPSLQSLFHSVGCDRRLVRGGGGEQDRVQQPPHLLLHLLRAHVSRLLDIADLQEGSLAALCSCVAVHSPVPCCCNLSAVIAGQYSAGSRISSGAIAVAQTLRLKQMQSAVRFRIAGKCLPSSHSIARPVCKWCCRQCVIRTRCIFCLVHQNRQAIIEYYIHVRKIYFYAAVGLLEGTNPMLPLSFPASMAER